MPPATISVTGLVKTFGPTRALDGLDLEVAGGEVHAFLGPNGSGKTTTITVLLGLLRADAGSARLLGGDPWRDAVALHGRLAYAPGDVNLWPKLTVGEVIDLRAVGDIGDGTLPWLSPIGWGQKIRPFAGQQWWPLIVPILAAGGCLCLAVALASRRDLGGGLVPPRRGPAEGSSALGTPLGLAARLQRGALVGWASGIFVLGAVYGSVAKDVDDFFEDMDEQIRDIVARGGGDLVESFMGTTLLVLALIGSGFALSAGPARAAGPRTGPL